MDPRLLLQQLHLAERLKDATRHCYTSGGRHESVAEHSWRLCLMAWFLRDEFPELDMDKVLQMCLIHDLGECFTGDIPTFLKSNADTDKEDNLLLNWVATLPEPYCTDMPSTPKWPLWKRARLSSIRRWISWRLSFNTTSLLLTPGCHWNMS